MLVWRGAHVVLIEKSDVDPIREQIKLNWCGDYQNCNIDCRANIFHQAFHQTNIFHLRFRQLSTNVLATRLERRSRVEECNCTESYVAHFLENHHRLLLGNCFRHHKERVVVRKDYFEYCWIFFQET